jgi:thioredoxin 1
MVAFITELNDSNFNTFTTENELVLVDIWAEWCGPCKMIAPIVDQLSIDFQGQLSVGKLDADSNRDIVTELGVRNIPTILIYRNGEVVDRSVGSVTKEKLTEIINQQITE